NVWNVLCPPENQQVKMSHSLCELSTGRAHDREKPNISQVCERFSTTVHSANSAADYQHGQQATSPLTGGGQFNISISSLNQSPTLATPDAIRDKIHKNVQKTKSSRLRFIVKNTSLVC
ncbi:unnamed protein product, partial [Pocillopora meandrina]